MHFWGIIRVACRFSSLNAISVFTTWLALLWIVILQQDKRYTVRRLKIIPGDEKWQEGESGFQRGSFLINHRLSVSSKRKVSEQVRSKFGMVESFYRESGVQVSWEFKHNVPRMCIDIELLCKQLIKIVTVYRLIPFDYTERIKQSSFNYCRGG